MTMPTKECTTSPSAKGKTASGAWATCGCGWYVTGQSSIREAKKRFGLHKHGRDPA